MRDATDTHRGIDACVKKNESRDDDVTTLRVALVVVVANGVARAAREA